jgi:esterase/lipase superfamily enzyme
MVQKNSKEMHDILQTNAIYNDFQFPKWPQANNDLIKFSFGLSSFGQMLSSFKNDAKLNVTRVVLSNQVFKDSLSHIYYANSPTVQGRLNITMVYNGAIVTDSFMRYIVDTITRTIESLI